ncbi:MAG: hypothetical protein K2J64_08725, partial [Desulfovibrio sp.]|nr:hypothetical protein [Desulfovibrio sp.]
MLNKISQAIADDWKQDPYYLLAEKSVDIYWGGGTIDPFLKVFKDLVLQYKFGIPSGNGLNVPKNMD